jgi:hypothetical protein
VRLLSASADSGNTEWEGTSGSTREHFRVPYGGFCAVSVETREGPLRGRHTPHAPQCVHSPQRALRISQSDHKTNDECQSREAWQAVRPRPPNHNCSYSTRDTRHPLTQLKSIPRAQFNTHDFSLQPTPAPPPPLSLPPIQHGKPSSLGLLVDAGLLHPWGENLHQLCGGFPMECLLGD